MAVPLRGKRAEKNKWMNKGYMSGLRITVLHPYWDTSASDFPGNPPLRAAAALPGASCSCLLYDVGKLKLFCQINMSVCRGWSYRARISKYESCRGTLKADYVYCISISSIYICSAIEVQSVSYKLVKTCWNLNGSGQISIQARSRFPHQALQNVSPFSISGHSFFSRLNVI